MGEKFRSLKVVGPMIVLFMMVTGVIYTGIATPTEASGLGAFGAFVLAHARRQGQPGHAASRRSRTRRTRAA